MMEQTIISVATTLVVLAAVVGGWKLWIRGYPISGYVSFASLIAHLIFVGQLIRYYGDESSAAAFFLSFYCLSAVIASGFACCAEYDKMEGREGRRKKGCIISYLSQLEAGRRAGIYSPSPLFNVTW